VKHVPLRRVRFRLKAHAFTEPPAPATTRTRGRVPTREVKCLSVKQPWAELTADNLKRGELKTKRTHYRGLVVIVSSLGRYKGPRAAHWLKVDGLRGHAIAVAELVDCRPATEADASVTCVSPEPGEFIWVWKNIRRLKVPVKVKGQLGMYPPSDELRAALVRERLL
jgi:hypothetical protein